MNERIFELADQASTQWIGGPPVTSDGYPITRPYNDDFAILFAELIVRECMDVAKDHTPDTEECEYTWLIHDKIKQHFGVEE